MIRVAKVLGELHDELSPDIRNTSIKGARPAKKEVVLIKIVGFNKVYTFNIINPGRRRKTPLNAGKTYRKARKLIILGPNHREEKLAVIVTNQEKTVKIGKP